MLNIYLLADHEFLFCIKTSQSENIFNQQSSSWNIWQKQKYNYKTTTDTKTDYFNHYLFI